MEIKNIEDPYEALFHIIVKFCLAMCGLGTKDSHPQCIFLDIHPPEETEVFELYLSSVDLQENWLQTLENIMKVAKLRKRAMLNVMLRENSTGDDEESMQTQMTND